MNRLFPSLFSTAQRLFTPMYQPINTFTSITSSLAVVPSQINTAWSLTQVRTKIRNYWPRASENKRIKKSGYHKRMSTPEGRKIIMRKILKGCHVLSH